VNINKKNKNYKKLAELLHNNMGYMSVFYKFRVEENISFSDIERLLSLIKTYKNLLKSYKINPLKYDTFENLDDDINKAIIRNDNLKFTKSFISNKYKYLIDEEIISLFGEIKKHTSSHKDVQNYLTGKLAAYKKIEDFKEAIIKVLNSLNGSWDIDTYRVKIEMAGGIITKELSNILIVLIPNYQVSNKLGSSMWCISRSMNYWKSYVTETNIQYFIFDFNKKINDNNRLIGVTVSLDPSYKNYIYANHDYSDSHFIGFGGYYNEANEYYSNIKKEILKTLSKNQILHLIKKGYTLNQHIIKYYKFSKEEILEMVKIGALKLNSKTIRSLKLTKEEFLDIFKYVKIKLSKNIILEHFVKIEEIENIIPNYFLTKKQIIEKYFKGEVDINILEKYFSNIKYDKRIVVDYLLENFKNSDNGDFYRLKKLIRKFGLVNNIEFILDKNYSDIFKFYLKNYQKDFIGILKTTYKLNVSKYSLDNLIKINNKKDIRKEFFHLTIKKKDYEENRDLVDEILDIYINIDISVGNYCTIKSYLKCSNKVFERFLINNSLHRYNYDYLIPIFIKKFGYNYLTEFIKNNSDDYNVKAIYKNILLYFTERKNKTKEGYELIINSYDPKFHISRNEIKKTYFKDFYNYLLSNAINFPEGNYYKLFYVAYHENFGYPSIYGVDKNKYLNFIIKFLKEMKKLKSDFIRYNKKSINNIFSDEELDKIRETSGYSERYFNNLLA
jgi:hypothetical protein